MWWSGIRGITGVLPHFLAPAAPPTFEQALATVAKENHVINRTPVAMVKVLVNQRHPFG